MMGVEISGAILGDYPNGKNSVGCRGFLTTQNFKNKLWFGQRISDLSL